MDILCPGRTGYTKRILNASGTFQHSLIDRTTGKFQGNNDTKRLQLLTVLALRDAFMHGELPTVRLPKTC